VLAGLVGASGVALAAVAAHRVQDAALGAAAHMLMIHAAAALGGLALGANIGRPAPFGVAALLLLSGAALFAGDIAMRSFTGDRLFALAAPTGGSTMIAGWVTVAVAGILARRRDPR
jgi:uncharacterized membrane protein YgdD (TMEM256/DUF423 family)